MSRKKKKQTQTPEELNRAYFQSLIATRSSLGMLGAGIAGAFLGIAESIILWGIGDYLGWGTPYDPVTFTMLVMTGFMLLSLFVLLIEPVRRFFFEHQRFSSIWQVAFIFSFTFILIVMTGLIFFYGYEGSNPDIYHSSGFLPYTIVTAVVYFFSILYNIFWLRGQLQIGISEERRTLNYLAKPSVYGPSSLGLIVLVVLIFRNFSGSLYSLILGIVGTIFLTIVFSRLHVEYGYAAILKWRDKSYWEEYDEKDGLGLEGKKKLRRLGFTIVEFLIIVGIINLTDPNTLPRWVLGLQLLIIFSIFVDWLWWLIRKAIKQFFRG